MNYTMIGKGNGDLPIFSIIVPVYNINGIFLDKCISSLINQSFHQIEIILVDDGSERECADQCDSYVKQDNRVRVIHQNNQGVSAARNKGIETAAAEWIMFVDSDDWLEPDACEILYKYLRKVQCDILFFNGMREYSDHKRKIEYGFENETLYDIQNIGTKEMLYKRVMGTQNLKEGHYAVIYYCWDKVYSRAFLMDNNLRFPVGIPKSEDKVFILLCMEKLKSMYYVEKDLYHYRINEESVCNRYAEKADQDRVILSKKLKEIAERMDQELGMAVGNPFYHLINDECNRFVFGIITDVIRLKYYHPDYPRSKQERNKEVKAFLNTEPFKSAIKSVDYSELMPDAKVKKFMLSHGMTALFYKLQFIKQYYKNNQHS